MKNSLQELIILYHEKTKHHFHNYATGPDFLDWQNQPLPFRFYRGSEISPLPLLEKEPDADYEGLYRENQQCSFTQENIAGFLELSLSLSAWKEVPGERWSLRINPSSGNLHPTEAYLILPSTGKFSCGVYHYNSFLHCLEKRTEVPEELWQKVTEHFKTEGFLVSLSSIFWREAWKYGERAFRYCNHDTGHAIASLRFSANLFGWKIKYLNSMSCDDIERILGFHKTEWKELEEEYGEFLCYVYSSNDDISRGLTEEIISSFSNLSFIGIPDELSTERVKWEIIYNTAESVEKSVTEERFYDYGNKKLDLSSVTQLKASEIIRQRRSAVDFNIYSSVITREKFFSILDKTMQRNNTAPFDIEISMPSIHLFIFVHNVKGLDSGIYFFIRNHHDLEEIKNLSHRSFLWKEVERDFPLYLLKKGNFREEAKLVSCIQDIAGDSAFSLGMIAKFRETVEKEHWRYPQLFWEAGMIGQVLYLEAEAKGLRGTGIGCFFDDAVHEIIGFKDNAYQSLYHFTIGMPMKDERLIDCPPYYHLKRLNSEY
jgi:SagB-type dehydrogenase family enzyme